LLVFLAIFKIVRKKRYADEGISGTSTKKREQFNAMVDDALAGKLDLIITNAVITKGQFIRACAMATLARFLVETAVFRPCAVATIKSPNETG
jgi:hypothetical protein